MLVWCVEDLWLQLLDVEHNHHLVKSLYGLLMLSDALRWLVQESYIRVSTNLTEQISRRFPGGISRKIQDMFALLRASACYVMWSCLPCRCSLPKYRTKTWYAFYTTWGCSKDKIGRPVSTQISDQVPSFMPGNQCGRSPYIKISRRSSKFQEISRSCRHPALALFYFFRDPNLKF